ncbi:MAG: macro domain-containing protein [Novipirellula sp. JB048]
MKSVEGDLLKLASEGVFDVIVHGCNCHCTMGAGIAKSIRDRFPAAYQADLATTKGDRGKLGTYSSAPVTAGQHRFVIVNAYTQFDFSGPGVKADYDAIGRVFQRIGSDFTGQRIGYPKIGAGLAGGDWATIAAIIDEALDGEDHTLVVFNPSA